MSSLRDSAANSGEIIEVRTRMLIAVFGKRDNPDMVDAFKRHLERYTVGVLSKAFTRAETELERFPTVRWMMHACEMEKPSGVWEHTLVPGKDRDGVACMIDRDPLCNNCRDPRHWHPTTICKDFQASIYVYRAEDCPEGRAFLEMFRKLASEKVLKDIDVDSSAKNLQAQKIVVLKKHWD